MDHENNQSPVPAAASGKKPGAALWLALGLAGVVMLALLVVLVWFGWRTLQAHRLATSITVAQPGQKTDFVALEAPGPKPVPLFDYLTADIRRWGDVPSGEVVCQNTPFRVEGAIRLAGVKGAREGKRYPGAVLGVPVHHRGTQIHLLQAVENWGGMPARAPYGKVLLHYQNGESRSFYLLFRVHGLDWFGGPNTPRETVADLNTQLGWSVPKPDGMYRRFFHTAFANPLPEQTILSADFICPLESANVWFLGLTITDEATALAPEVDPDEVLTRRKLVAARLVGASQQPASTAVLAWRFIGPGFHVNFPPFPADAAGRVILDLPISLVGEVSLQATGPGGSSWVGNLQRTAAGAWPDEQLIPLRHAETPEAPGHQGAALSLLDLTASCNAGTTNAIGMGSLNHPNNLGEFPTGEVEFDGLKFLVTGVLHTGEDFSAQIPGVRVGRPCRRLHLLHGLTGTAPEGKTVGRMVLHYADGSSVPLEFAYGRHVRDWWKWQARGTEDLAPGTAVAWTGYNSSSRPKDLKVGIYRSTFENPKPDLEIVSFDWKRDFDAGHVAPFLLGVTLE